MAWGFVQRIPWGKPWDRVEKPVRGPGPGNRGQTGLPADFRQKAPETHGRLVSPRRARSPEGQFFMKLRGPKAHPNRQPVSGKVRRKLGVTPEFAGSWSMDVSGLPCSGWEEKWVRLVNMFSRRSVRIAALIYEDTTVVEGPRDEVLCYQRKELEIACHSYLKATIGSTRTARRPGRYPARAAVPIKAATVMAMVNGSTAPIPKSTALAYRAAHRANGTPTAIPAKVSAKVSRSTRHRMGRGRVPSARRMPISEVRRATA